MVIGPITFGEVSEAIGNAEAQLRRAINPTVYPVPELRKKVAGGHQFLKNVLKGEKLFVLGDEHELDSLLA